MPQFIRVEQRQRAPVDPPQRFSKNTNLHYISSPHTQLIGQRIIYKAACASTNTWAVQYLQEQALPEGTVFITDHQYQGRGQRGNRWESTPHKNLTFSIVLYPTFLSALQSFALNIITTLAIRQVLSVYVPHNLTIKWPNDIYYQNHKIGGVLIENTVKQRQLKVAVIGIGLNVNQAYFAEQGPVSLTQICGKTFDLQQILAQVLAALERNYLQLRSGGIALLRAAYLKEMYWTHQIHVFQDAVHKFEGKISGINAVGQLIVKHSDGMFRCYNPQEVAFIA